MYQYTLSYAKVLLTLTLKCEPIPIPYLQVGVRVGVRVGAWMRFSCKNEGGNQCL